MKKLFLSFLMFAFLCLPNCAEEFPIDAAQNAQMHNNKGVEYMKERDYFAAIQEFKFAIAINPYHQTTAVFFNNLGKAYLELAKIQYEKKLTKKDADFAEWAKISFEAAIDQDYLKLQYYENLADSIELTKKINREIKEYTERSIKNPMWLIEVALLYEKKGEYTNAKICIDEFIVKYPDLIIIDTLRNYIKKLDEKIEEKLQAEFD